MNVGSFSDSSFNGLSPIFKGNRLKLKFFKSARILEGKRTVKGVGFKWVEWMGGVDGWGRESEYERVKLR